MLKLSDAAMNLWGKKDVSDDNEFMWLPLIAHMIDTKNTINYLYNHYLSPDQKRILNQNMEDTDVRSLVQFLGFIHDIGKATPVFQTQMSYLNNGDLDQEILEKLYRNGFEKLEEYVGDLDYRKVRHDKAGEVILERKGLNKTLASIVGGHHGLPQIKNFNSKREYKNYFEDYIEDEENQWTSVQNELINYGLELCNLSSLKSLPEVSLSQAVILNGLVIMADWLASSFPLIKIDEGMPLDMDLRWKKGVDSWQKQQDEWATMPISDSKELYKKRFGFDPRDVQAKITEQIDKSTDPGMIIIEAPMGLGKTEIALTATEQLAAKNGDSGLFFGLPTQATTNAMFTRVHEWLRNLSEQDQANYQLNLMHGKSKNNEEYQALRDASNIAVDDFDNSGSVITNAWFTGKKSILSDFSVGTIDQLLLMGLKRKHLALSHLGLSRKVVVIDEVHAYDLYMNSYLKKAIEWLGSYHVPVVALSATLPAERRKELIEAYGKGKYGESWDSVSLDAVANEEAYPLLSILDGKKIREYSDFKIEHKSKIRVTRITSSDEDLVNKVCEKIGNGGVAGVIVNTVKRAQILSKLAEQYLKDNEILVLHSAFLASDREKREIKLQTLIGKKGKRPHKLVVFGTQVLEQSLDIDFDILFTDIAPVDLILQRAGRLHRHEINRPTSLKTPHLYLIGSQEDGYGEANETIYGRYLLKKSDYFIEDEITLPDDISPLVQKVYSPTTNSQVPDNEESYEEFCDKEDKKKSRAKVFQIVDPNTLPNLHGFLDAAKDDLDENQAAAAVRDIQETIEVVLLKKDDDQIFLLNGENIEDLPDDSRDRIISEQTVNLPHRVTFDIPKAIKKLEKITLDNFEDKFANSTWLKGALILPLDKNLETTFNGYRINYSSKYGLIFEQEK